MGQGHREREQIGPHHNRMSSTRTYKLRSPAAANGSAVTEVVVRRLSPGDSAAIATAIREERQKTGREVSDARRQAIVVATLCDLPLDLARRIGRPDLAALTKIIGGAMTGAPVKR